ncbi:MAG TPA: carboxypeptidase-like regulatory domain-containing protein [Flavobacterium sp.]|uniref:carboxypeptidase-like regulatory domain-containing protein n=1 Tax=Flavobacterium sp. TaxID=239 RepID=UPI002C5A25DB|nr:carboxypeptidase-like regulatory domain-containing protein [Flavobacterium sp.]HSD15471.1 carboxypeptidase-like regulatory domain-containing protein [Flavobacterium sp.]
MKKIFLLLCLMPLLMANQCNDDDDGHQVNCTEEARAGLNVTVMDAATHTVLTEGVVVVATEGTYSETLELIPGSDVFSGAWERQGNYMLTVTKSGYQTYTSETITVDADVCHVIPQSIMVHLIPE